MTADPEPSAVASISRAPRLGIRLLCWFAIYFAAQLPFMGIVASSPTSRAIGFFVGYPFGLLAFFGYPFHILEKVFAGNYATPCVVLLYGFYLTHLIAALRARGMKAFCILLAGLFVLVTLDTIGCVLALFYGSD